VAKTLRELLDQAMAEPIPETVVPATVNQHLRHVPVVLLIDSSGSMEGAKINAVNAQLSEFFAEIGSATTGAARTIRDQGDFAVIRYGHDVRVQVPWTHGSQLQALPAFRAGGGTPMGEALVMAGQLLLERFRAYSRDDAEVLCGAVFNLTDGAPTDMDPAGIGLNNQYDPELQKMWNEAKEVIAFFEEAGSRGHSYVQFFHLGVPGFDADNMEQLSAKPNRVYSIESNISEFFDFIKLSLNGLGDYQTISDAVQARLMKKV
jgi:uncharacterized protein YegL